MLLVLVFEVQIERGIAEVLFGAEAFVSRHFFVELGLAAPGTLALG